LNTCSTAAASAGFKLTFTAAVRVAGLAFAPPMSGWLLKFAFVLWRPARRRF
jgi:hypothetical protein